MLLIREVWELIALPYAVVEAGRQWQLASGDFRESIGMKPIAFLPQGFLLRKNKRLVLLVAKVVDDFIIAGTQQALEWLSTKINARFKVGTEVYAPEPMRFNGALIRQDKLRSIKVCMKEFADSITPIELTLHRRKQSGELVAPN